MEAISKNINKIQTQTIQHKAQDLQTVLLLYQDSFDVTANRTSMN